MTRDKTASLNGSIQIFRRINSSINPRFYLFLRTHPMPRETRRFHSNSTPASDRLRTAHCGYLQNLNRLVNASLAREIRPDGATKVQCWKSAAQSEGSISVAEEEALSDLQSYGHA